MLSIPVRRCGPAPRMPKHPDREAQRALVPARYAIEKQRSERSEPGGGVGRVRPGLGILKNGMWVLLLMAVAGGVPAQSLGEVARREQRRRAEKGKAEPCGPAKVYSDADLASRHSEEGDSAPAAEPVSPDGETSKGSEPSESNAGKKSISSTAASAVPATGASTMSPGVKADPVSPTKTEAYWKARKRGLESNVKRAEYQVAHVGKGSG